MPEIEWDDMFYHDSRMRRDFWHLIWPTTEYLNGTLEPSTCALETGYISGNMLFLNPEVLALMEPDILSQMRTYESVSVTPPNILNFPPHIKSYARVFMPRANVDNANKCEHSDPSDVGKIKAGQSCQCTEVAWFLLTSACLSRGMCTK